MVTPKVVSFGLLLFLLAPTEQKSLLSKNGTTKLGVTNIVCPLEDLIRPCYCYIGGDGINLSCNYEDVTQEHVNTLFSTVRIKNDLRPTDLLTFHEFRMQYTELTQLDLTPLCFTKSDSIYVRIHNNLTTIVPPACPGVVGVPESPVISTRFLALGTAALTDQGLGDILHYFDPTAIDTLWLHDNELQGSVDKEFVPGLARLTELKELEINSNKIQKLGGGQFRTNNKLIKLYIGYNPIIQIGPDAFTFDDPGNDTGLYDTELTISLTSVVLPDAHYINDPAVGLQSALRPFSLDLRSNGLEHLSSCDFLNFLDNRPENNVYLSDNPIICDRDVRWLKSRASEYQNRVDAARCVNDKDKTVFTSTLV